MQFSGNTVIEPRSDRKQQIAFIDSHVGSICPMHSQVADIQRMAGRYGASSHYGSNYRNPCLFCQLSKFLAGMGDIYAAACQEKRTLRLPKHLDGPL